METDYTSPSGMIVSNSFNGDSIFNTMIKEIERMQQENKYDDQKIASYYSSITRYELSSKLYIKLEEIGYISKLNAKKYYYLMVLIADDYFKVPIHTSIFYSSMQKIFGVYNLQQKDENMTRFCFIVKKLNVDVLQKLANVMAKSSRTVIPNVTDQYFLKLLRS